MSQREDLLRGAQECIAEKGYARTTARDITAASGANLASIGYYFGSKDALLHAAVIAAFDEWGTAVEDAMQDVADDVPLMRLQRFLESYIASLPARRNTLVSSIQAMAEAEYAPEVKQEIASSHDEGRRSLAALVLDVTPDEVTREDLATGSLVLSLMNGLALQWFISPDTAPSAAELATAIVALVEP
ncbi:TetR/AcrR family transcriptional regulator [Aeromicrobium sp. CTD01-1L150]|uniref:TetR/AcrR family transcriptional regulator n=1 Tax=Aeromicrobium sp. CTD01-1L150 TaxID=3341830 RepID=UPI0035BF7F41